MFNQRPRNFNAAVFKFRLTKEPLPTDGDLLRTITRGVRGTAMPAWYELPINDRLAVIQYIKYELAVDRSDPASPYAFFVEEPPGPPLLHREAARRRRSSIIDRGKEVWQVAKCWECHGQGGKGDGEKAAGLKDDLGFAIIPADLTSGQFKSGPAVEDIFRTMTTGLSGTPMPSYRDALPEEDRWALSYYVLSLSAYKDPLTREPLAVADADRAALNDLALASGHSGYRLCSGRRRSRGTAGKHLDRRGVVARENDSMGGFEITGPYASAMLMSLGALCVFVWAVLSGAFHGADEASRRFCEREIESDEISDHAKPAE